MFYFYKKIIITNKYNITFIPFIPHTHTHTPQKNHVDFKYVYLQKTLWKKRKKNLGDIIVVQMYEIMKIQMNF
jgi:hypothetical protein